MSANTEPHNDPAIDLRAVTRAVFEILRPTTEPAEVQPPPSTLPSATLSLEVRPAPTAAAPSVAAPPAPAVPQSAPAPAASLPVPALVPVAVGSVAPTRPAERSSDALAILDEIAFLDV